MLRHAVQRCLIVTSPVCDITLPTIPEREMVILTVAESETLASAVETATHSTMLRSVDLDLRRLRVTATVTRDEDGP